MIRSRQISRAYVESLLIGAAPERKDDVQKIWAEYDLLFHIADDAAGTRLSANTERVVFDHKTMAAYWLLSFASWRALECYSPAILVALRHTRLAEVLKVPPEAIAALPARVPIAHAICDDVGLADAESRFFEYIYAAHSIIRADDLSDEHWPSDIPCPEIDGASLVNVADRAVFDLACISTAYAFCHEIRHVQFAKDRKAPVLRPEEELACDVWAREFLTAKIGEYSAAERIAFNAVLSKRSKGAAVGMFVLYETTDRWSDPGTEEYPPVAERFDATLRDTKLDNSDDFWIFYASVLVAILRRRHRSGLEVSASNGKELCELLVEELRRTS